MKTTRHIVLHCVLAMILLILPLQNAWSMASMVACDMDMSPDSEMSMDMVNCDHHAKLSVMSLDDASQLATQDCADNHCSSCSQISFALLLDVAEANRVQQPVSHWFNESLVTLLLPLDSPPPIFS